jgi:hypothetical protein
MLSGSMHDGDRYMAQAEAVLRLAARAGSAAERRVYETIAEGWRKLAVEARRNERHEGRGRRPDPERESFRQARDG